MLGTWKPESTADIAGMWRHNRGCSCAPFLTAFVDSKDFLVQSGNVNSVVCLSEFADMDESVRIMLLTCCIIFLWPPRSGRKEEEKVELMKFPKSESVSRAYHIFSTNQSLSALSLGIAFLLPTDTSTQESLTSHSD